MRPLEVTRAGVLGTVAVFIVVAACVRLGFWQLDRRADRLERNAAVAGRLEAGPIRVRDAPTDTAGLGYRRAEVTGRLDHDRSMVLAGRSRNGAPGVYLLTPLRLSGGAILVNRGWLPAADGATVDLEDTRGAEQVRVEGVLLPFPDSDRPDQSGEFRTTWYRFDGDAMRAQLPYPVAAVYLRATSPPEVPGSATPPPRPPVTLDPPSLDPGPHLSYAIQWFSFALIFLVGWAALLVRRA